MSRESKTSMFDGPLFRIFIKPANFETTILLINLQMSEFCVVGLPNKIWTVSHIPKNGINQFSHGQMQHSYLKNEWREKRIVAQYQ